jgi:site-specific DNA-methyltransferase (adenine-specific)
MLQLNDIYLGDSYKLLKEIKSNTVDLVIVDPPYKIVAGGGGGAFGVENRSYHNDVSKKLNYGITDDILFELNRIMKKTNIYIFCNKNQLRQYFNYFTGKNIDLLVWHKVNPIPTINNKYLSDLEYIFFAREPSTPMFNTYESSSKLFQSVTNKKDKELYKHPTIKPLWIIERLIRNSSQVGDVVLDCFLGSGTTAVASKKLNRQYIGIEIDEEYFRIAKDRLEGISQQDREVEDTGQMNIFETLKTNK